MCMCWRLCSSLTIRTGEEVRVSTAISVASLVRKPRLRCPKTVNACCSLRVTNCGIQKCSGEEMSPGAYEDVGKSYESRPLTKSAIRCAGAVCRLLPCMKQSCSSLCWKRIISSGSSRSASIYESTSSGCNSTTMPLLDHCVPRLLGLMPLTTICPSSVAAGMTKPPGHMQNE